MNTLQDIVESTVRSRLNSVDIFQIDVEEGEDHDGDPIITIRVVFDGEVDDLDIERVVGLTRHLRTQLETIQEDRFPITRLMTRADFEGAAA